MELFVVVAIFDLRLMPIRYFSFSILFTDTFLPWGLIEFQEVPMIAKILIKRRFKEGNTPQIVAILNDMRRLAMSWPGYQSGETLIKNGFPNDMTVISTWRSLEEWQAWKESDDRRKFEAMLEIYQDGATRYEEYLLGSPLHGS
jgi:heme-degrading monooxygenase HmoA